MERKISITIENEAQFRAALESGRADLIYVDAAYMEPADFAGFVEAAHEKGVRCGLRLPHIWRAEAGRYFAARLEEIRSAGFDCWLFRNREGALWFAEQGLLDGVSYSLDHGIYVTNKAAAEEIRELLPDGGEGLISMTCPLELNAAELKALITACSESGEKEAAKTSFELVIYGRVPMMISAQCLQKTARECRKGNETTLMLEDRKGALMPVKNSCRFCFNTIYNSVPVMLYDLTDDLSGIGAASWRYEFTTETPEEVRRILRGELLPAGGFTRGHFRKSVL